MFLSNLSIKRPVFATVMMLGLATLGVSSYRQLSIDLMPDVEIPVISVITPYPGASPASVERDLSKKIEEAVNPIAGVDHVNSISLEGVSQVIVEFQLEVNIDQAVEEARTKIAGIRGDLPPGIGDPVIEKIEIGSIPVISLAVRSTTLSPRDLSTLVDRRISKRLENVAGVGKVDLVGLATREVAIHVDPGRLDALGMGVDEVMTGLRAENIDTPLGRMKASGREVSLRVQGKADAVEQFRSMIVATRNGRPIALGEVATVEDGIEEVRSLALVNGVPAVAIDVMKQSGANTVAVADAIAADLTAIQSDLPAGTTIAVVRDGSRFIRESVADVKETLVLGGLLTILIVFVFLNSWRSTVITGLTLPISVISSFIIMRFAGMTLNVMTLMALSLAIGLLIDDAIVVRENIVRHLEHGEDHFQAAREGTSEIGLAVLATTCSILAVFVPVAFMGGIVGRFFFAFGLTVAFAVAISLFVSFTLDPMLSSRWHDPDIARAGKRHLLARLLDRFNAWFDRTADGYKAIIAWALDHRMTIVGLAVAAFVAGLVMFRFMESEFFPPNDEGEFAINITTAPDASIDETRDRLEVVLKSLKGLTEVDQTYASIGAGEAGTVRDLRVYVKLKDRAQRERDQFEIQRDVRGRLAGIPGIIPSIALAESMDNRKPLLIGVRGDDIDRLKEYSQRLKEGMYRIPGVVDLSASLEYDTPEYRLIVDRARATDVGLNTARIAGPVSALVGGEAVTTFEDEEGEARNVRVRLPEPLRQDPAQLGKLRLAVARATGVELIPLSSVARYELSTSASVINRRDLSRQVEVGANLDGLPLGTAVQRVNEIASGLNMAPGYRLVVGGENEVMVESFRYMGEALILAVIFVYLILAAQFESFVDPLAIMLSLPLSIVGMAAMLLATGDTLNVMSLIGLILLMGLVTKNAILLVDFAKVLRSRGLDRRQAVIQAGRTRLRPIIMTTTAMIFGMLPLALGIGAGGEMRAPMARAVIGGLITSTLLTLLVVPVVYTLLDDAVARLRRGPKRAAAVAAALTILIGLALGPGTREARGQQGPTTPGVRVLTLDDALAVAAEQNRDVQKAREYQKWVHGKYIEERAAALPNVSFGATALRQFDDTQSKLFRNFSGFGGDSGNGDDGASIGEIFGGRQDVRVAEVSVTQPIFTWGQVGAAIRAARIGYQYADHSLRRFRQAVTKDVSTAYIDVVLAKDLAVIADENLAQRTRHFAETSRKASAGTATDYDVLAAQVAAENAKPAVVRAQNGIRASREQLRFLLAEPAAEVDVTPLPPLVLQPTLTYEQLLSEALANRPEVAELAAQRGIYRELVTISAAANKPRVDFAAGFGKRWLGLPSLSSSGTTWNATIIASVPLFDGMRTRGRVAQAEIDLSRAKLTELQMREAIALEVRNAVNAVHEAEEIMKGLEGTVKQAEQLLFLAEKGYELGVKIRLEVEDAQLNQLQARGNLARAQRDYRVARVNLAWATGK